MSSLPTFIDGKLNRESLLSRTLDAVKWPLSILVLIDHFYRAQQYNYGTEVYDLTTSAVTDYIEVFIISFFRNFPVPTFFFISGYLVYCGSKFSFGRYKKRIASLPHSIIKPYIIWNIFALLLVALTAVIAGKSLSTTFTLPDSTSTFTTVLKWLRLQFIANNPFPVNVPLWYMRDLVVILLAIPIVHPLLKLTRGYILIAFALLFILYFNDNSWFRIPTGLLFFYTGYWMRMCQVDPLDIFRRIFIIALLGWVICGIYYFINFDRMLDQSHAGIPYPYSIVKNIGTCCFVPVAIYSMAALVRRNPDRNYSFLASASFFIYVTHYPLKDYILHWSFRLTHQPAIILPIVTILTPLILTAIYHLLRQSLRHKSISTITRHLISR